jgi:LicD family
MPDPRMIPRKPLYILDDQQILGLIQHTKSIKQRLLDVLVLFDTWAKSVGLTYCLDWGTLLGAIRHNGRIIPWDDDLDVTADEQDLKGFLVHEKIPLTITVNGHSCKL